MGVSRIRGFPSIRGSASHAKTRTRLKCLESKLRKQLFNLFMIQYKNALKRTEVLFPCLRCRHFTLPPSCFHSIVISIPDAPSTRNLVSLLPQSINFPNQSGHLAPLLILPAILPDTTVTNAPHLFVHSDSTTSLNSQRLAAHKRLPQQL